MADLLLRPLQPCFNPRPPHGGRLEDFVEKEVKIVFQSTPPARGATHVLPAATVTYGVSIHAPRTGGDHLRQRRRRCVIRFQSTPPARGATGKEGRCLLLIDVSIHAPRTGGDIISGDLVEVYDYVSIHAPRTGGDPDHPPHHDI